MKHSDYVANDALGLARLIDAGEITAAEALAAASARLDTVNGAINAVILRMDNIAQKRACESAPGAFAGVPFLLKDMFQDYAGVPTSSGNRALKRSGSAPTEHAEITRRFIASGVNIFGKTNTPEFAAKGITEPEAFGPTRNPWDLALSPGGSSGGAAAAVAAGVLPMAGANDGGGSIRIPAACCGLFGFKPGRARVPGGPLRSDIMHGVAVDHVLTRSVRDSAAMLDAIAGYEPGAIARLDTPDRTYLELIERPPRPLRIGLMTDSPFGKPLHTDALHAIEHSARLLESLGHDVEYACPALDSLQLIKDFLSMWFVQMAVSVADVRARTGAGPSDFELDTRAIAHVGRALSATDYVNNLDRWQNYRHILADFHAQYDLLLTPTLAGPPTRTGEIATPTWQQMAIRPLLRLPSGRALLRAGIIDRLAHAHIKHTPFTQMANLTGVPAMSVPLYVNAGGLPLGSQFVAGPGGEALLLQLAAQLERTSPWFDRQPALCWQP